MFDTSPVLEGIYNEAPPGTTAATLTYAFVQHIHSCHMLLSSTQLMQPVTSRHKGIDFDTCICHHMITMTNFLAFAFVQQNNDIDNILLSFQPLMQPGTSRRKGIDLDICMCHMITMINSLACTFVQPYH